MVAGVIPAEERRNRARGRALEVDGKGNRHLGGWGARNAGEAAVDGRRASGGASGRTSRAGKLGLG